jgi:peptidoglycan hydrolase-like protein with peptidoglycan-binding domain
MQRVQAALAQRGYAPGPADGQARPQTHDALRRFQMDNHMAAGQITVESARALGVVQ